VQNEAPDTSTQSKPTNPDLTFSLSGGMLKWAQRNNCQEGLVRLIDTANTFDNPKLLGILISELTHPETLHILGHWVEEFIDPKVTHIYRVAQSVISDSEIFECAPKPERGSPPKKLVKNITDQHYLLGLTAQHNPFTDNPKQQSWYRKIRLWITVQAYLRELDGITYDKNIRYAAGKLRLAGDLSDTWKTLLFKLESQVYTFDDMSQALARKSDFLLKLHHKPDEKNFLKAIKAIAEGDTKEFKYNNISRNFRLPDNYHSPEIDQTVNHFYGSNDAFDDMHPGARQHPGSKTSPPTDSADCNEKNSHLEQALEAKSVYMAYAETRHYLPCSWQNLFKHEAEALENWIEFLVSNLNPINNMLGAIIWIATRTGRSMLRCLDIQIENEAKVEWSLTRNGASLIKLPPIRQSGWKPTDAEKSYVIPAAKYITITIPAQITRILKTAQVNRIFNHSINDLWPSVCPHSAESYMTRQKPSSLKRITPGMLGTLLGQRLFNSSNDASHARLLSSHPEPGLPGSCGYPYWSLRETEDALMSDDCPINETYTEYSELIGAGSQLVPLETLLRTHLEKAHQRLIQSQQNSDLITFHNMVTAYITLAFWAGTAIRTINDPIENPTHMDLTERTLFVCDKLSGGSRDARLLPLPTHINDVLIIQYQEHLKKLARKLKEKCPNLSREITKLSQGEPSRRIPFLFHLTQNEETLSWISISEFRIKALKIFDCPLPLRLFRHRLAYRLRNRSINPEVIDGFLGHAEYGTASYGDYSTRCWAKDMKALRPALNAEYESLNFKNLPSGSMPALSETITEEELPYEALFGIRGRERKRRAQIKNARASAENTISQFINEKQKQLEKLDGSELDELTYSLLFNKKKLPRQNGFIQYTVLINKINRLWKEQGKHVRISRRYHQNTPDQSAFNHHAIGVLSWHAQVVNTVIPSWLNTNPSSVSAPKGLLLATLLLCLEGKITDRKLLLSTLKKTNYRLIVTQNKYYIEYSERLDEASTAIPVRRFPISFQTAKLLDRANQSNRKLNAALDHIPNWLKPLHDTFKNPNIETVHDLINGICDKMNQVNALTLPGIVSGYLSGRTLSAGIDWYDWVRMTSGNIITVPSEAQAQDHDLIENDTQALDNSINGAMTPTDTDDPENLLKESAHEVLQEVLRILEKHSNISHPNLRRDINRTLKNLLHENNHKISSTIHFLIQWTCALLFQKKKGKQGKSNSLLAISTVKRYLNALSPRFEGLSC